MRPAVPSRRITNATTIAVVRGVMGFPYAIGRPAVNDLRGCPIRAALEEGAREVPPLTEGGCNREPRDVRRRLLRLDPAHGGAAPSASNRRGRRRARGSGDRRHGQAGREGAEPPDAGAARAPPEVAASADRKSVV